MRILRICAALALLSAVASAQQKAPTQRHLYSSAADITAMIAKSRAERKETQPIVNQNILRLAPYSAGLEYRASVGPAAVHETEAEMFYVIEGSGTMVTGGKLVGETRTNAENLTGTGIEGGSTRVVGKGDFILVPEKTAHWFSKIDGTLVLMSLHVPHK